MNVFISAYHHYGEGQTTCCSCAYHGLGTGAICWSNMVLEVYVNEHHVGVMCSQCFRDLIHYHEERGNVVHVKKIERGD